MPMRVTGSRQDWMLEITQRGRCQKCQKFPPESLQRVWQSTCPLSNTPGQYAASGAQRQMPGILEHGGESFLRGEASHVSLLKTSQRTAIAEKKKFNDESKLAPAKTSDSAASPAHPMRGFRDWPTFKTGGQWPTGRLCRLTDKNMGRPTQSDVSCPPTPACGCPPTPPITSCCCTPLISPQIR